MKTRNKKANSDQSSALTASRDELIRDGTDAKFRELVHALLAFSSRLESVRQEFGAHIGLSGIQYTVLVSIAHLQGVQGAGVNTIAKHLSLSGAFVTIEVNKLTKLKLVAKRTNPEDRRRVLLTTTKQADALLNNLAPIQREVNNILFEPLTARGFDTLLPLSKKMVISCENALAYAQYLTGSKRE